MMLKIKYLAGSVFILIALLISQVSADALVWKVSKDQRHIFIGGTIHILTESDYPLPLEFEAAYSRSGRVIFETDLKKTGAPEFQQQVLARTVYPEGRSLKPLLTETTYQDLLRHLSERDLPAQELFRFRAGMVSLTLLIIELDRLGLLGAGVDEFFARRALSDRKKTGWLETAEEQLNLLVMMGEGKENELIRHTLRDIRNLPALMQDMKDAWRRGDGRKLETLALVPMKTDFPELYDQMVVRRNTAWIPKIEALLRAGDTAFVLVGFLHLLGEDSVLAGLSARGCEVAVFDPGAAADR